MNSSNPALSLQRATRSPDSRWAAPLALSLLLAMMCLLAGCGPVRLVASTNIPPPLVMKIPVAVAVFMPAEFSEYVHKEERWHTDWNIEIGKAQSDAIMRLFNAMFERVVVIDSLNAGAQLGSAISAILEPSVEEYAFVTPRDAGSPFFAVSIKYRVNVYLPDGKLADSWGFTGYGTAPAGGLSNTDPLANATGQAMRDAGAKLAVEFREQAVVRGLLPDEPSADEAGRNDPAVDDARATETEDAAGEAGASESGTDEGGAVAPTNGEAPSVPEQPASEEQSVAPLEMEENPDPATAPSATPEQKEDDAEKEEAVEEPEVEAFA